ncbi:hypothetical protein FHT70_005284 [Rhizobium sp. BK049]|uniref:hypothetical protein n=1 Tax=Rhizobium sp. BK049 TaxID=2587095 RepID=UPI00161233CA|nr:hypothetical protein [Rhizobium sp. BK049]MBB3355323.1 hypothetical protein [Rhizobium sp. BK049]
MFAVEGYQSLKVFAKAAYDAIYSPVKKEDIRRWLEANKNGQPRPQHPFQTYNASLASQDLVYDLFVKSEYGTKRVQVLRADGVKLTFPLHLLRPYNSVVKDSAYFSALKAEYERQGKERVESWNTFKLEALKLDYWVVPFLEGQAFSEPDLINLSRLRRIDRFFPVVNWNTGCIDLGPHKVYLEAVKAFRSGITALQRLRIDHPPIKQLTYFAFEGAVENEDVLRSLLPFDGCSIIAPEEWLEKIKMPCISDAPDKQVLFPLNGGPRDMIITILDEEPGSNKADVKAQVMAAFPKTSHRKFDQVWASVAEEKPHIQMPGRKSRHRFETVS